DKIATEYGDFMLHTFRDTIQNETHLALTLGDIQPDSPCVVRVQTNNYLRDVLGIKPKSGASWSSSHALQRIAAEGEGV
ncbi:hypothetical protein Q4595_30220, partial [Wenyingzhuangia sp. 1_MG-2023]|nr:hypothetical protein [Wenyingzhuangia sp. 1_MG-2023]